MSVVVAFGECLARPSEEKPLLLVDHLEGVAQTCGLANGKAEQRLAFLAGLLHDAGKCQAAWQAFVTGHTRSGPPHAPLGAALFAYWAESLIPVWEGNGAARLSLRMKLLDWVRVIYGHHGDFPDLEDFPPWYKSFSEEDLLTQLSGCDRSGLVDFVQGHFPDAATLSDFDTWLGGFYETWEWLRFKRQGRVRTLVDQAEGPLSLAPEAFQLPSLATSLVAADRFHAGEFQLDALTPDESEAGVARLESYCATRARDALRRGASQAIVLQRDQLQREAVKRYRANSEAHFFSLTLPTGFGKTLTALRVALEACRQGRCRRVIYVAPYLAILSQAALEIANATGLEVWQHHHLSSLEMTDDHDVDALDTWQAPVLTTTFNQLFRAIFPSRAQHCLRRPALERAFVIIDEPQIIDPDIWNLFLSALEWAAEYWDIQILFATATLPPLKYGLEDDAVPLAGRVEPADRFVARFEPNPMNAAELADALAARVSTERAVSAVLNTVADAAEVYALLSDSLPDVRLYCLTGAMLPWHKAETIQNVRQDLERGSKLVCVSTQILEAGVDLSFRAILRSLPLLPSVVQVAGRANRHGEGQQGLVDVFPFVREDGVDSRKYVYKDATAVRHTDGLLEAYPEIPESQVATVLQEYYRRCWAEAHKQAFLDRLRTAALGKWSDLAGTEPFGGDYGGVELFVPWPQAFSEPQVQRVARQFHFNSPEDILEKGMTKQFRQDLDFIGRRRYAALLHRFTVSVPRTVAQEIGRPVTDWLWEIEGTELYSEATGLAHLWRKHGTSSGTLTF